jgi:hypothetical protein
METITNLANALAAKILPQVFKQAGKFLKQEATKKASELVAVIRNKLEASQMAGILDQLKDQPTEETNQEVLQKLLENQMKQDDDFTQKVKSLVEELDSLGAIEQTMLSGVEVEENIEAENMTQKSSSSEGNSKQEMATNLKAKNVKLGNLNQEN